MDFILRLVMILFIFLLITRAYMAIARHIGEKLGIGKFFIDLWKSIRR